MKPWQSEFLKVFRDYFQAKKESDPQVSIRSLARDLNISPGPASALLKGSRTWDFSSAWVLSVIERMELRADVKNRLLVLMDEGAKVSRKKIDENQEHPFLSRWYYSAIVTAADLKSEEKTSAVLSRKLGISIDELEEAKSFMAENKMITLNDDGTFQRCDEVLETGDDIPSQHIRQFHVDNLNLCQQALTDISRELREFQAITFTGNKKNLDLVKTEIRNFVEKVAVLMNDEKENDEIYRFSMQLFPVDFGSNQQGKPN